MNELKSCGFAYYSTDRGGNGARLWSLLQLYFGPWGQKINEQGLLRIKAAGFGPKFRYALQAYVLGNSETFPLDSPAFETLRKFGFYMDYNLDEARNDVLERLKGCSSLTLIDFHELLRFRSQFGEHGGARINRRQTQIILGWNGWRILSLSQKSIVSPEWVRSNLIKDDVLAGKFATWFFQES